MPLRGKTACEPFESSVKPTPVNPTKTIMKIIPALLSLLLGAPSMLAAEDPFRPLFDGKTLDGWTPTPGGEWNVVDGAIVGTSKKSEPRHGILLSDRQFSDFIVKAKFRVLTGDSGFYFRTTRVPSGVSVHGFQVEVDDSLETGGLYETGGRGWVRQPDAATIKQAGYQPGEWTDLELRAFDGEVVVKINGVVTSELKDDPGRKRGHFGLQLHGGQDMHVEYRDIMIREIDDLQSAFVDMFNGKDLAGWKTTGNWVVEPDGSVTLKPRPGEKGWQRYDAYLTTERKYRNFVLDLEFKFAPKGNSGVFMRVGDLQDHVKSGFEVQILDTHGKEKFGAHDCGGVIGTSAPAKMAVKPAGQWNRYIITLKEDHLQVVLNGQPIQDLKLRQTRLKDRPAEGYISFQDEAKRIWYRNVRIKELP